MALIEIHNPIIILSEDEILSNEELTKKVNLDSLDIRHMLYDPKTNSIDMQIERMHEERQITGKNSIIGGGDNNASKGDFATVGGGCFNQSDGNYSTVGGGHNNMATGYRSTIAGGFGNRTSGEKSIIGGGKHNTASGLNSTVAGGHFNNAEGINSTIVGGEGNLTTGIRSYIGAGEANLAAGHHSVIVGGFNCTTTGSYSFIGGGKTNRAYGPFSTINGGCEAQTNIYGQQAYASGMFKTPGDSQISDFVVRNQTVDAQLTELFVNGTDQKITVPNLSSWFYEIKVIARRIDDTGEMMGFKFEGIIDRTRNQLKLIGNPRRSIFPDKSLPWTVHIRTRSNALVILVRGEVDKTINWTTHIQTVEVMG